MLKAYEHIRNYLHAFLHLFYPQICFGCGSDQLDQEMPLCNACIKNLPYTDFFSIKDNPIEKLFWGRAAIANAGALVFFTKESLVQLLMAKLKYHHNKKIGLLFGKLIGETIASTAHFKQIDLLIPIPIRPSKMQSRGYNQSQMIALGIQSNFACPIETKLLLKKRWSTTQTKKNRTARLHQVPDLFTLHHPENIKGKNILIVDDVVTTGATLEAAIQCLMQGEPASISIAVAAYTI